MSWRERLDDPAFGNGATAAACNHAVQFVAQCLQVGDLSIYLREVLQCDRVDSVARSVLLVGKLKQRADLVEEQGYGAVQNAPYKRGPADENEKRSHSVVPCLNSGNFWLFPRLLEVAAKSPMRTERTLGEVSNVKRMF